MLARYVFVESKNLQRIQFSIATKRVEFLSNPHIPNNHLFELMLEADRQRGNEYLVSYAVDKKINHPFIPLHRYLYYTFAYATMPHTICCEGEADLV